MKNYSKILIFLLALTYGCTSIAVYQDTPTVKPTPSIDKLMGLFSSPDHNDRVYAASEAGFYWDHPDRAILLPYLVDALSGPDYSDRGGRKAFAAQSIRMLGIFDETAFNIFTSWINNGNASNDELLQAIQALMVFPDHATAVEPGLIILLEDNDAHLRQAAIQLLSLIDAKDAIPSILKVALSDEEENWVRRDALRALAIYGPNSKCAVRNLVPLLDSSDTELRVWSASAIYYAVGKTFPSEDLYWDLKDWHFSGIFSKSTENRSGEYLIVKEAKKWWQETGQFFEWPECCFNTQPCSYSA